MNLSTRVSIHQQPVWKIGSFFCQKILVLVFLNKTRIRISTGIWMRLGTCRAMEAVSYVENRLPKLENFNKQMFLSESFYGTSAWWKSLNGVCTLTSTLYYVLVFINVIMLLIISWNINIPRQFNNQWNHIRSIMARCNNIILYDSVAS
jgi:hypothetical protein